MEIAEVIKRESGLLLRIGFGESGRNLVPSKAHGLTVGAFVGVRPTEANAAELCLHPDGTPVVYAEPQTALARLYRIAAQQGVRLGFSEQVIAEVEAAVAAPGLDDPTLENLRHLPFITIDYEESRDLDQALHIERGDDGFVVRYALADAAYYIRPGTALFSEALQRGASYYLPGLTIPMLPTQLSEGIISLNPGVDRRALVFVMTVAVSGKVTDVELVRGVIHSRKKLTYDGVQRFANNPDQSELFGHDFSETLHLLGEVGALRIAEAEARDVVKYDRVGVRLTLPEPTGSSLRATAELRNDVQRWNEHVSLMTNIAGAEFLTEHTDPSTGFAGVFRVHPEPDPEDVDSFDKSIRDLVSELRLSPSWLWQREPPESESLGDYVDRLPDEGQGSRLARALQRQAILINRPSIYSTQPGPHHGIGARVYSRFSSPMREIVGVVTKHMAFNQLAATPVAEDGFTTGLIERAVVSGNRAKKLQKRLTREAHKLAIDSLFQGELSLAEVSRPYHDATVMGVSESKIYLQLDSPPMEIKLYVSDQERLLKCAFALRGRYTLASDGQLVIRVGQLVSVQVADYDEQRQRWILRVADVT